MGDWGHKISKDGYDVKTASSENLAMSSAFNSYKVKAQGTGSVTVPAATPNPPFGPIAGSVILRISHGFSYAPAWLLWYKDHNGRYIQAASISVLESPPGVLCKTAYCDTSDLTFEFNNTDTAGSKVVNYYYFIFEDPLS